MKQIVTQNNGNGTWNVFNKETGRTANVVTVRSYSALEGWQNEGYRVDVAGRTMASGIRNFQAAKSKALQFVE